MQAPPSNVTRAHANGAVGLGSPGLVEKGTVRVASNFPTWSEVPLQALLSDACGAQVSLVNDALAAAAAEAWVGAASRDRRRRRCEAV